MKKILVSIMMIASIVMLASCGEKKPDDSNVTTTGSTEQPATTAGGSCDSYLAYLECTYKKANTDEATIKSTLDQTKAAWAQLPEDQMNATCQQAIDALKTQPTVEGCEL